jgi:hypothetical protein
VKVSPGVTPLPHDVGNGVVALAAQHGEIIRAFTAKMLVGAVMHLEVLVGVAAAAAVLIAL